MDISAGQGVKRKVSKFADQYALIFEADENFVSYMDVVRCFENGARMTYAFDDTGASFSLHSDNVRLKDCPPPFSDFGWYLNDDIRRESNAIVVAGKQNTVTVPREVFESAGWEVIDNGELISNKDMNTVKEHPWPRQPEKELTMFLAASPEDDSDYEYE